MPSEGAKRSCERWLCGPVSPYPSTRTTRAKTRELGKKLGVEIKHAFLTTGDSDLLLILDAPDGGNVAKFALAISSLGNVRTRTARAWPEAEYVKMMSELP